MRGATPTQHHKHSRKIVQLRTESNFTLHFRQAIAPFKAPSCTGTLYIYCSNEMHVRVSRAKDDKNVLPRFFETNILSTLFRQYEPNMLKKR
jgi:hypothetical protein